MSIQEKFSRLLLCKPRNLSASQWGGRWSTNRPVVHAMTSAGRVVAREVKIFMCYSLGHTASRGVNSLFFEHFSQPCWSKRKLVNVSCKSLECKPIFVEVPERKCTRELFKLTHPEMHEKKNCRPNYVTNFHRKLDICSRHTIYGVTN